MPPRKKEPPKPLYPLKHDYEATLANALSEFSMLLQVAKFIADQPESMGIEKIQERLRERVRAAQIALYGDD